jgi:hypothetical protein
VGRPTISSAPNSVDSGTPSAGAKKVAWFGGLWRSKDKDKAGTESSADAQPGATRPRTATRGRRNSVESMKDCQYSGYVSLEEIPASRPAAGNMQGITAPTTWARVFLYLSKSGDLYYFRTKAECPNIPVNSRPIETDSYDVITEKIPFGQSDIGSSVLGSGSGAQSQYGDADSMIEYDAAFAYEIRLVRKSAEKEEGSKFRVWKIRLDTHDEMMTWAAHINPSLAISTKTNTNSIHVAKI